MISHLLFGFCGVDFFFCMSGAGLGGEGFRDRQPGIAAAVSLVISADKF